jgi:sec-independent protein translocase protein TatA
MSALFAIMGIGTTELMVVMAIMLLLFGHRLPSLMRSLGRGVVEFKKGISGEEDDLEGAGRISHKDEV